MIMIEYTREENEKTVCEADVQARSAGLRVRGREKKTKQQGETYAF